MRLKFTDLAFAEKNRMVNSDVSVGADYSALDVVCQGPHGLLIPNYL
jgi:hypothetical protein